MSVGVTKGINGTYIKINYPRGVTGDADDQMVEEEGGQGAQDEMWDDVRYIVDASLGKYEYMDTGYHHKRLISNIDPSVRDLVDKILPLATYYMSISAFVDQYSRYEYGSINHALAAAISSILKEYETFIAQLEYQFQSSESFTLQQFWFYMQDDNMQQMGIIHDLAMTIRGLHTRKDVDFDDDSVDIEAVLEGLKKADDGQVRISDHEKGGAILNILTDRLIRYSG